MNVLITEYLRINLDTEKWECRCCGNVHGSARDNYKRGLLVYDRDPSEIHKPLLDIKKYDRTYAPDPTWCRILEYYCPSCGVMVEAEYLPPGHPPVRDIELDIDSLKLQWKDREEVKELVSAPDLALQKVKLQREIHSKIHNHSHDDEHDHKNGKTL